MLPLNYRNPHERMNRLIVEACLEKDVDKACRKSFREKDPTDINQLKEEYGWEVVNRCKGINNARQHRKKRLKDKLEIYLKNGRCSFVTLTFDDDCLKRTNETTRRKYVTRFLKANGIEYVANIDFGNDGVKKAYFDESGELRESTCREHYHAVIFTKRMDYRQWHKYGAIQAKRIRCNEEDLKKVAAYVTKLSNHAMKVNGGRAPRLIYSRTSALIKSVCEDF